MHLTLVHTTPRSAAPGYGFTSHDRIALTCWMQRADAHGYRRMLIEGGSNAARPEEGGYVLLYAPDSDWATWGVARAGEQVVIWHCGTGADLGRYPSMMTALDSLPPFCKIAAPASQTRRRRAEPLRIVRRSAGVPLA